MDPFRTYVLIIYYTSSSGVFPEKTELVNMLGTVLKRPLLGIGVVAKSTQEAPSATQKHSLPVRS